MKNIGILILFWGGIATLLCGAPRNVLFIAIDDLNDWVGCLGGNAQAQTPHIDRLAAAGTLFTNAHCQAPICNPSRNSLISGKYPSSIGVYFLEPLYRDAEALRESESVFQYFRKYGYESRGIGKLFHHATGDARSFEEHAGYLEGFGPIPDDKINWEGGHPLWDWGAFHKPEAEMTDARYADWMVERLQRDYERPFFLSVGFVRPHVPLYAPQRWLDRFPLDEILLPETSPAEMNDISDYAKQLTWGGVAPRHADIIEKKQWEKAVQAYLASVAFVDDCVGRVWDALQASPYSDNTVVVVWSDHGFHLGEKQKWGKRSLWEESTRVPFIIISPDLKAGQRCARPVGLVDLYPTLVELCGLPEKSGLDGQSLMPLLVNPDLEWRRPALTTLGPGNHALRSDRWRYIRYADGSEELYDHDVDPAELTNLAGSSASVPVVEALRAFLPQVNVPLAEGSSGADSPLYPDAE